MTRGEKLLNELFAIVFIALIAVSLFWGYWKLVVLQDFVIFTSEDELPEYVISSEESGPEE